METTNKLQKLNTAAEKAANTFNNGRVWEANRNNAAARLMAISAAHTILCYDSTRDIFTESVDMDYEAAAEYLRTQFMAVFNAQVKARAAFEASFSAIKAAATPLVLAAAVNSRGFQFDAAIRGCYSAISAAAKAEKAEKWQQTLTERAEKAAAKAERADNFAAKAERAAAVKAAKARIAAEKAAASAKAEKAEKAA